MFPDYTALIGHPEAVSATVELPPSDDEDSPGFLEILANMEDANPRIVKAIELIGREVQLMGDLARDATERVHESDARGAGTRGRLAIALEYADSLKGPAERLDEMVADYEQDLGDVSAGFDYLMGRIESAEDLDDRESAAAKQFVSIVIDLGDSTHEAMDSLARLLGSLEQVGAMARPVRQQTTRIRRALERFSDASSKIFTWADRAVQTRFAEGT
jgi:methyl-accepting chemotaxis protein